MKQINHRIILLFFIAGVAFHQQSNAQKKVLFSSFFAEKNLSSLNITCFFQDSKGYMWIGTEDGVNYFNGKTIKTFKHDYQYKNSLPDNVIVSICEDKQGFIWIGTGRGISKLNPNLLSFENFYTDNTGAALSYKLNAYVDRENNTWATAAGDLYKFNKTKNSFEKKPFVIAGEFKNSAPPRLYSGIFEDSQKRYWVSSSDHLYRYFPNENRFELFSSHTKSIYFFPVKEGVNGELFTGTWNDGMYKLDAEKKLLIPIDSTGLHGCYVTQKLNGETMLWYGNQRLTAHNDKNKTTNYFYHDDTNPYSCKNNDVSVLFVDAQNQLWIGYATKGIQIMSPSNQNFKTYKISDNENDFPVVNCFIKSDTYDYAGGWYNYSLAKLNKDHTPVKKWKTLLPGVYDHENNISDAWRDKKGNIWFTSSPGLIKFNEATGKAELFKMDKSMSVKNHFLQMVSEGDSVLWIAGYFCGLSRFSLNTKTFQNWGAKDHALYWGITKDNAGMLWLADNSGTLTGFDPKKKTFITKHYDHLTEGAIYHYILFDSIGNVLWVASNNGLLKIDRKTFAAKLFTEKDNLPTNQVNAIQFDSNHRLWIATNKGLCFYEPEQNLFKSFFSNNGLPENVLTQLFSMQQNDELFIGCRDGFSVLKTNAMPPDLFLQSVSIDKIYESGKIVQTEISGNRKTIELNYDQDNIQIEFSSNDLINPEDNQLLFRLEGFDDTWHTAPNGIVNYSRLAPGKYLFHVSGIDHTGLKAKHDDYLAIIITPPFWKRTWFILLAVFCIAALLLIVARYIFTRNLREKILILEKEQAIEKERNRISQDMHDELGSGLTKISIMSEVAKMQITDPDKAKYQLENISSSSRGLVDNLQDIIWILNSKNDSLENLCAYIQEYALKYFEPFDMDVHIHFPEKILNAKLSEDQRRNVLLVFKETFNNISKHSCCKVITVNMAEHNRLITFSVADNGKGFDKNKIRHFANGLENMKKRMGYIHGAFNISSSPGNGTVSEFIFSV